MNKCRIVTVVTTCRKFSIHFFNQLRHGRDRVENVCTGCTCRSIGQWIFVNLSQVKNSASMNNRWQMYIKDLYQSNPHSIKCYYCFKLHKWVLQDERIQSVLNFTISARYKELECSTCCIQYSGIHEFGCKKVKI